MNQKATGKAYLECVRMLNCIEKSIERHPHEKERRWDVAEADDEQGKQQQLLPPEWLTNTEPRTLNT